MSSPKSDLKPKKVIKRIPKIHPDGAAAAVPELPTILEFDTISADVSQISYHIGAMVISDDQITSGLKIPKMSDIARRIYNQLITLEVNFILEQRFPECRDEKPLPFDFAVFVSNNKICKVGVIEADGQQHFVHTPHFQTEDGFKKQQIHDIRKNLFTRKNNISLLRISDKDKENSELLITKFISAMRDSDVRVEMFSNPEQYPNPYGIDHDSHSGCVIS